MKQHLYILIYSILIAGVLTSCSTTRNLPEGEILYTGIRNITIENPDESSAGNNTLEEVEAALSYPPNNALLGSSSLRTPIPFGLWVYNSYVNRRGALNKWIFNTFAATPVLIGTVNPDVRNKVAQNLLHEYGYFNSNTSYEIIPDPKNPRKAKIDYKITMNNPYTYDSIWYARSRHRIDTVVQLYSHRRLFNVGDNFNVITLDGERQRIATLLRNEGYYFYHPEYIVYQADTTMTPGKVALRLSRAPSAPRNALQPWKIGNIAVNLIGYNNEWPTDSLAYKDIMIYYEGKLRVRPSVLYRQLKFKSGDYYSERRQERTQSAISRLGIFRYTEMQHLPADTARTCDTLNVFINASYDLPLDGELEFNMTTKSNNQTGPGAIFSLTRRNVFGGGEVFNVSLNGSYEWQTQKRTGDNNISINSYEVGASTSLTFPRVVFPGLLHRGLDNYSSSTFRLYGNQLNRARFFRMLSFGGSVSYNYRPTFSGLHTITPFRLSFNKLKNPTDEFNAVAQQNPILFLSLKDQFIPAMAYTYTYENATGRRRRNNIWWEFSVTEAGNLLSAAYALNGNSFNKKEKKILGNPFAQFIKITNELRYTYRIDRNQSFVTRLMGGIIYSYGNATVAPFNEQFYIGGANSLRAYTIRSIGPGRFQPDRDNIYSYIDQTGDVKFEANAEYRFRILGDLHGATFLDAGNIWLLSKGEESLRPGGHISESRFPTDLALGTGVGLRYDMDFLVVRIDLGIALHNPSSSNNSYFNAPFMRSSNYGLHLAIGYPF